jgi:hypothetical protein
MKCGAPIIGHSAGAAVVTFILRLLDSASVASGAATGTNPLQTIILSSPNQTVNILFLEGVASKKTEDGLQGLPSYVGTVAGESSVVISSSLLNFENVVAQRPDGFPGKTWTTIASNFPRVYGDSAPSTVQMKVTIPPDGQLPYTIPEDLRLFPVPSINGTNINCTLRTMQIPTLEHGQLAGWVLSTGFLGNVGAPAGGGRPPNTAPIPGISMTYQDILPVSSCTNGP